MRKVIGLLISILLFFFFTNVGQATPDISASQGILMDAKTGDVLYEKEAYEERPIASITKIMTALLAVESGKLEEEAVVSRDAIYTEGSSIYLEQGEKMSVKDLTYGLMLRSGNDAAVAIAEHIGGSVEGFVYLMNEKATWLGMNATNFENPHGLDADDHYSSAYDMAILTKEALKNEQFKEISGTVSYLSEQRSYYWKNKHRLVTGYYEYATGGKTGYTRRTGRTLVTTAEKNGTTLIAVTLNGPNDWNDHISLFEWGFDTYDTTNNKGELQPPVDEFTYQVREESSWSGLLREIVFQMAGVKQ
jgi:D-alanyl-D-alanine carboxypeptidase